jgi:germination protein M
VKTAMTAKKIFLRVTLWTVAICFVLLLPGCLKEYLPHLQKEEQQIVPTEERSEQWEENNLPAGMLYPRLYFIEGKGKYLLPVTIALPWTEGVAKATLEKLIEGPTPAQEMRYGLRSPLPPTTRVLGLSIGEGLAKLDLNAAFLDYDPGEEEFVLNSVIYTLAQFPAVKNVQLLIEGIVPETFPGGTPAQEVWDRGQGINREEKEVPASLENKDAVTLYFCTALGENNVFYIPVTRFIPVEKGRVEATIAELCNGPHAGSLLFSDLPAGLELQGFVLQNGILTVDFSREIFNYQGGRRGEKNMLMQLILTLTGIPGVEQVQILVDGKKVSLPYGTPCQGPLARPPVVNPMFSILPDDLQGDQSLPDPEN